MDYFSSILLAIVACLPILSATHNLKTHSIYFHKSSATCISILFCVGTFISMILGKVVAFLLGFYISKIFGVILLFIVGIYFLCEYRRHHEYFLGYDTSFYYENNLKYKNILEHPKYLDKNSSRIIDISECLSFAYSLILNSFSLFLAVGIIEIDIGLCLVFIFLFSLAAFYIEYFIGKFKFFKYILKYHYLITGILLMVVSILKIQFFMYYF